MNSVQSRRRGEACLAAIPGRAVGSDSLGTRLEVIFARVFRRLDVKRPIPHFQIDCHRFAGLRSTISIQDSRVLVRVSDLLAGAPPIFFEALAEILLTRVFGRRPSREARECYQAYVGAPAMRRRIDEVRRERGYKQLLQPQGRYFHLEEVFARLNRRFFQGRLSSPRLGWSRKRSRTILGHYDSAHETIIINRRLDSPSVPRYLVEYLVFHEMLHLRHPVERRGHRRIIHSREFLKAERKFPKYEQAHQRLKLICP